MAKAFMPDMDPKERKILLQDNADKIEETPYYKDLTPEEIDVKRESFTNNSIQLSQWEDELDEVKARYKALMKPVKEINIDILGQIKTRKELIKGILYHFADQDEKVMNTYDENGEFVSSRRLKPEERQIGLRTVPLRNAGNDQ